jgi:hypothetical protein
MDDSETRFLKLLAAESFDAYGEIAAELDSASAEEWADLQSAANAVAERYAHGLRRIVKRPVADAAWSLAPLFSAILASLTLIAQSDSADELPVELLLDVEEAEALSSMPELRQFVGSIK